MRFLRVTGLVLTVLLMGIVSAQATTIDTFNALSTAGVPPDGIVREPRPPVLVGPILFQGTIPFSEKSGPILGGTRELQLLNHGFAPTFTTGESAKDVGVRNPGSGTLTTTTGLDSSLTLWWDGTNEDGVGNNTPHTCPSGTCSAMMLSDGTGRSASGLGGVDLKASAGENGAFIFEVVLVDVALDVTIVLCAEGSTGMELDGTGCIAHQFTKPPLFLTVFEHPFAALKGNFPGGCPGVGACPPGLLSAQDGSSPITLAELNSPTMQEAFLGRAAVTDTQVHDILTNLGAIGLILRADVRTIGSIDLTLDQFGTTHAIPEPATLLLMGSGLAALGLAGFVRQRRRSQA